MLKDSYKNDKEYKIALHNKVKRILRFHKQLKGKEKGGPDIGKCSGEAVTQREKLTSSLWPASLLIKQTCP